MKSPSTIRRHKRELRALIDSRPDPTDARIAYAMETALTWATEKTVGWGKMADTAKELAQLLRDELRRGGRPTVGKDGGR